MGEVPTTILIQMQAQAQARFLHWFLIAHIEYTQADRQTEYTQVSTLPNQTDQELSSS